MFELDCLHIVRNAVTHDSRVLKETRAIQQSGLVSSMEIAGFHEPSYAQEERLGDRVVRRVRLTSRPLPKGVLGQAVKYAEWYARLVHTYRCRPLRVIHCHDLDPLPIAARLKKLTGAKLVYDAHELETERAGSYGLRKWIAKRQERLLMGAVDAIITVSPSIRDWYQKRYPDVPITLVRNVPERTQQGPVPVLLREELGVPEGSLLFLYLGGLTPGRGIAKMLEAFQDFRVQHYVLFMGSGPLVEKIRSVSATCERVHYREPVPPDEVLAYAAGADVGLCLIDEICLSYRFALPNKLFESLLAGLPVLASDLPDQAAIVRDYDAGWVVENNVPNIVDRVAGLSADDVDAVRHGLVERVRDLSWENESRALLRVYEDLLA